MEICFDFCSQKFSWFFVAFKQAQSVENLENQCSIKHSDIHRPNVDVTHSYTGRHHVSNT